MVRLGQNFLADPNLLDAIVRDAELAPGDVVLEVGAGEGVLSERLAAAAAHLHTVEIDRGLEPALEATRGAAERRAALGRRDEARPRARSTRRRRRWSPTCPTRWRRR